MWWCEWRIKSLGMQALPVSSLWLLTESNMRIPHDRWWQENCLLVRMPVPCLCMYVSECRCIHQNACGVFAHAQMEREGQRVHAYILADGARSAVYTYSYTHSCTYAYTYMHTDVWRRAVHTYGNTFVYTYTLTDGARRAVHTYHIHMSIHAYLQMEREGQYIRMQCMDHMRCVCMQVFMYIYIYTWLWYCSTQAWSMAHVPKYGSFGDVHLSIFRFNTHAEILLLIMVIYTYILTYMHTYFA